MFNMGTFKYDNLNYYDRGEKSTLAEFHQPRSKNKKPAKVSSRGGKLADHGQLWQVFIFYPGKEQLCNRLILRA